MKQLVLGIISLAAAIGATVWLYWVLQTPHFDWPRGESGLIAIFAAGLWGVAGYVAGLVVGIIGLFGSRSRWRWWPIAGVVLNAAALVVIGLQAAR